METVGWRATAIASGIIILLVTWPVTQVKHHRPDELGETREDFQMSSLELEVMQGPQIHGPSIVVGSSRAREALRTSSFWWISLGHATSLLVVGAVMVHLVLHVHGSLGYSLGTAGLIVALVL
ncbi:MAG: hypothetical protein Ct9H300mP13_3350 [Gammaproteobacteria bacterium]|nr:MAG: hypothetical protein Ct9H300mP13_3350 [Gammaproteobacteria bacterium]